MFNILSVIKSSTILGALVDIIEEAVLVLIGPLFWALCDIFFLILDLLEDIFRIFAGIKEGGVRIGGDKIEGDIVLYLIQSEIIQQIFMSILTLSLFLLIMFTILAIVKNQYAEKQESVTKIIGSSFKALLMYLMVPIATIVCLLVGNIVLQAIDGATRATANGGSASDMLFMAGAYDANKLRDYDLEDRQYNLEKMITDGLFNDQDVINQLKTYGVNIHNPRSAYTITDDNDWRNIAQIVDDAFVAGKLTDFWGGQKYSYVSVSRYYHVLQLSVVTIWVGGAFLIGSIGKISWGVISRLFKMTLYFAMSPIIMAVFPIKGDGALKSWTGEMVKNGTMSYCAVGVLNILYSILPAFLAINIEGIYGLIASLFIAIIAFSSAGDLIGTVSGWFGTGNAFSEGQSAKKTATEPLKKAGKTAAGVFGGFAGGMDAADKQGKNKFWGGLTGAANAGMPGLFQNEFSKARKDAEKGAADAYKTRKTTNWFTGGTNKDALNEYEGHEIVNKEKKGLDIKIGKLEAEKDKALSSLAIGSQAYKDTKAEYDKKIQKVKAGASYLGSISDIASKQEKLDESKDKNEKRSAKFAALDNLWKSIEDDQALMEKIISSTGATGKAKDDLNAKWEQIKQGNFTGINKGYAKALEKSYEMYANDILSNEQEMKRAKRGVQNLYDSGEDGQKYLRKAMDINFNKLFDTTTGKVFNTITDVTAVTEAIQKEQDAINDAVEQWKKENDNLIKEKAAKYSSLVKKDFEDIGKNAGK